MHSFALIVGVAWASGLTAFIGGLIASVLPHHGGQPKRWVLEVVLALGGGLLLAGITLALVPTAAEKLPPLLLFLSFFGGGISIATLDATVYRSKTKAPLLFALGVDSVPEALALCATFGHAYELGVLLSVLVGAQNLPEGFGAFHELVEDGQRPRTALQSLFAVTVLAPISAAIGHLFLHDQPWATATIMAAAAGGILYLVFKDIAPSANPDRRIAPALGAVLGFAAGMLGKTLLL